MENFSVTSWNVQRKLNFTGRTSIKKIKAYLQTFSSDIILLQEMCGAEKIIEKNKGYNIYIPSGYNYNVILSKYRFLETREIIFPKWNNRILQNCTRADIQLNNKVLRVYNCQLAIFRVGIETRLKQLEYILNDAKEYMGPVIIAGDLNVTIPKPGWNRWIISKWHQEPKKEMIIKGKFIDYDERELFNETLKKYGFKEALDLYIPTWSPFKSKIWEMFKLKLDWFIVKDLKVLDIKLGEYVSDHRSIEAICSVHQK